MASKNPIALWEAYEFETALRLFAKQANKEKTAIAWLNYGEALARTGQSQLAAHAFQRTAKLALGNQSKKMIIDRLLALNRFDLALPHLRKLTDNSPIYTAKLILALERSGKTSDEPWEILKGAQKICPSSLELDYAHAMLERRNGDHERALAILDGNLRSQNNTPELLTSTQYARAHALDKLGQFESAFAALEEAKRPLIESSRPLLENSRNTLRQLAKIVSQLSPSTVRRWQDETKSNAPPICLLTGFPRSGTSLLEQMLDSHPGILSTDESTIFADAILTPICVNNRGRFPDEIALLQRQRMQSLYWKYQQGNVGDIGQRLLLDKNPGMTPIMSFFKNVFPQSKTIFMLRQPQDVMLSCFFQDLPVTQVSVHFLNWPDCWEFYQICLNLWLQMEGLLGQEGLAVRYEDVVENEESESRRIISFLDLPWDDSMANYRQIQSNKTVLSPTYADVKKPIFKTSIKRWINYQSHFQPETVPENNSFYERLGYGNG